MQVFGVNEGCSGFIYIYMYEKWMKERFSSLLAKAASTKDDVSCFKYKARGNMLDPDSYLPNIS